jgi:hypothetical protein
MKLTKMQKHLAYQMAIGEEPETFHESCNPELVEAIKKQIRRYKKEAQNETVTLTGQVKNGTEKAIRFSILNGPTIWIPRSIALVLERALGPCDQVEIPGWFAKKNQLA